MIKFLIDMPLSPGLADWLIQQGYDAGHASRIGLHRALDQEILARAANEQRIVVPEDLNYPRLFALTQTKGPGLILFRGGNYSEIEAIVGFQQAVEAIPANELFASIVVIEKTRNRCIRVPLERC